MKKSYSLLGVCALLVMGGCVAPQQGLVQDPTSSWQEQIRVQQIQSQAQQFQSEAQISQADAQKSQAEVGKAQTQVNQAQADALARVKAYADSLCKPPVIHYIGGTPWIFKDNLVDEQGDVEILVKGKDLVLATTSVHVGSLVPALAGRDYEIRAAQRGDKVANVDQPLSSDMLLVSLKANFVKRLQDKDDVTVSVDAADCSGQHRAFGIGKFLVRNTKFFRDEEQKNRFPFSDITATPLSFKEAHYLFGPLVAENYFVVKLALRNTSKQQRILTTGMIRVSGMALVEPADDSAASKESAEGTAMATIGGGSTSNTEKQQEQNPKKTKRFTLPITVSPLGLTQLYKIMDDTYPHHGRSVFFRTFDFFGAVASAAASPFGASGDLVRGLSLMTGSIRPGLDKAWHDSWPVYRSNVVEFGMQDMVKVVQNAELSQKFIFFSKNTIQAQLQDPAFFGQFAEAKATTSNLPLLTNDWYNAFIPKDEREQPVLPKASAVSLFFNQLDIPFETVDDLALIDQGETAKKVAGSRGTSVSTKKQQ